MDKNDILDYVTETPGNTNRAVLGSMLDSFSSGGGDSDFSTATVTVVGEGWWSCPLPAIVYDGFALWSGVSGGKTYTVVLYKDRLETQIEVEEGHFSYIGEIADVEYYSDADTGDYGYNFTITGDCTITIS